MTLNARPDRALLPRDRKSDRYLLVRYTAPQAVSTSTRTPLDVAFVLDRSGSMSGSKIALARQAVERALAHLDERDRFSVVVYDDRVDVVVEGTPASPEAKRLSRERLASIDARGSTNLSEGWLRGCEQLALLPASDATQRCLLLTDGLANQGITDRDELATHAAGLRERGIRTSTFGVGNDFDEVLLQQIADGGGGNFYYIERAVQIADHMTSEVGEAVAIVARDATLEVIAPTGVVVTPLTRLDHEHRADRTLVQLRDLVSGQDVELVLHLAFPAGRTGDSVRVLLRVSDRDGVLDERHVEVGWQYADEQSNERQPRDRTVDRAVAALYSARAREDALELNRRGDYERAAARLTATAARIRGYAAEDAELTRIAEDLDVYTPAFAASMPAPAMKQHHFRATTSSRMRDEQGRAKRGGDPTQA